MAGDRRRPEWMDRVREALRILAGLAGEVARLIDVIRSIR